VDLRPGVGLAAWLTASAALASRDRRRRAGGAAAVGLAGLIGLIDDQFGSASAKGLKGHLDQLRHGRVTTGALKIAGLTLGALVAAAGESQGEPATGQLGPDAPLASRSRRVTTLAVNTVLVAGLSNLINLLDLRPGRALKAATVPASAALWGQGRPLAVSTLTGIAAALPSDLTERSMLGDCGAGALGASVGVAAMRSWPFGLKALVGVGLVGLTLASEKMSFSAVIDRTDWLRRLDQLGRAP